MREMYMPYDIDVLCKIRHECFRRNIEEQRRKAEMVNNISMKYNFVARIQSSLHLIQILCVWTAPNLRVV